MGTLRGDLHMFMIISSWTYLRMRNISYKDIEKIKTHFIFSIFFSDSRAVDDMIWTNMVKTNRQKYDNITRSR
jgi:hypothetical protein